jgi:PPM family protein phosphatase
MIPLDVWGLTDLGARANNEDSWSTPPAHLSPELAAAKGRLYVVCDGMGGHQAGEIASHMAAQIVQQSYYSDPDPDVARSLEWAIKEANRRIHHNATTNSERSGMGTTLTAAVLRGREVTVANVGDSRVYLIRGGQATQISQDHTLVAERLQSGILTAEEARRHPQRHVVTRSLGHLRDVQVDIFPPQPVGMGDVLLLCTDGLSEMVQDTEMAASVSQSHDSATAVRQLVETARSRGAPDNVTVLIVAIGRPGAYGRIGVRGAIRLVAVEVAIAALAIVAAIAFILTRAAGTQAPGLAMPETTAPVHTRATLSAQLPPESPLATPAAQPVATVVRLPSPGVASVRAATPVATPMPAPIPLGPVDGTVLSAGELTAFEWKWEGDFQDNWGFEVLVWQEGESPQAARDARETRKEVTVMGSTYRTEIDLHGAASVRHHGQGNYLWSVQVVQLDPYLPISQPGLPAVRIRVEPVGGL